MLLAFIFVWIASIIAAIAIGSRIRWWLIWRLLLFVPLFGELALFGCFGDSGRPIGVHMLVETNTWFWGAVFLIYGVILFGPSAIVLGGLGWMAVEAKLMPLKVSKSNFILLGIVVGALTGDCFQVVYQFATELRPPVLAAGWTWGVASLAGGAAGGFIVAYYATKSPPKERDHLEARVQSV